MGSSPRRWVAFGNEATGFLAFGNVATGVIAVGNVARGLFAFGNVAVGVVAVGNVGFGVLFGAGGSIGVGLIAVGAAVALPVIEGGALAADLSTPFLAWVPPVLWFVGSLVMPGTRPPRPNMPVLTPWEEALRFLEREPGASGWVRSELPEAGERVRLAWGGEPLVVDASPEVRARLGTLGERGHEEVLVRVAVDEELDADAEAGYRRAAPKERVLRAVEAGPVPERLPMWEKRAYLQWALAWAWRVGAGVGLVAAAVRLILGA